MSEVNIHELQMLVTKCRHADDDSLDGACREAAKYIHDQSVAIDTFKALIERGPLNDGDVPSKSERDLLLDVGLCVKVAANGSDGANAASQLAWFIWKQYTQLTQPQIADPEGADGVIGGTGTDDSGVELTSVADPVPALEGLTEILDVELLWTAIGEQFHQFGKDAIRTNRGPIERYAELLTQTYCDPTWVKNDCPDLGPQEIKHQVHDAKLLQYHCHNLIECDLDKLSDEMAVIVLQHCHNLHDKLYDTQG